jgi:aldose 1-epimerase
VPWPNQVAGAEWTFDGEPQHLVATEPERGNAIHGLTRHLPWRLVKQEPSRVNLAVDVPVQPGWPVPLTTEVDYSLDARGLTIAHTVTNTGERPVPFGVGTHPYPRAGHTPRQDCTLRLAASTILPLDPDSMIPTGPAEPVENTPFDFREPQPLEGLDLDTPFGGCLPSGDGLIHHHLTGPDGAGVEVWADPDFRWVQVFTPDSFPGRGSVVAIEPMTCPPDALNSGADLITLAPGESWTGRWGLRPFDA